MVDASFPQETQDEIEDDDQEKDENGTTGTGPSRTPAKDSVSLRHAISDVTAHRYFEPRRRARDRACALP
jgi:hypothetical protein